MANSSMQWSTHGRGACGVQSYMTRKLPEWNISGSVVCVVAGCVVASLGDFTFEPTGYIFALTSVMLQCFYLLLVERSGAEKGVGTAELLFYNSVLSLPFLILVRASPLWASLFNHVSWVPPSSTVLHVCRPQLHAATCTAAVSRKSSRSERGVGRGSVNQ